MQKVPMALLLASVALGLCPSAGLGQGLGPGNPIKKLNEQVAALEARVAALETASTGTVRTVFEVQIDPSTDGDETFSYSSRTDHYAKISTGVVSLSDPPLIQVFYRPAPKVLGGNLPAPDTMSVAPIVSQSNVLLVREGEVLVLYKRVLPTTPEPFLFASPEPDGLIHLRVVVVK